MLTSFFGKSRPINFIVVAAYILVFYILVGINDLRSTSVVTLLRESGIFLIFLLSVVLVNFIATRNELTSRNANKTILFAGFACMLLQTLKNDEVILANFFVLLGMRRIISLRSHREVRQKIFDATFWILIASLFYFWSVLFLAVVFFGIVLHEGLKLKNWLLPFVAFVTLLSIVTCGDLLLNDSFYTFPEWYDPVNLDFTAYRNFTNLIPVAFLLALTLWASFFFMIILQKASSNSKSSLMLIFLSLLAGLGVAVLAPEKNTSELLFFLAPLAIVVTNYFQMLKDRWFKESLLILVVFLPVVLMIWF